jgi:hypothetical protein
LVDRIKHVAYAQNCQPHCSRSGRRGPSGKLRKTSYVGRGRTPAVPLNIIFGGKREGRAALSPTTKIAKRASGRTVPRCGKNIRSY